MNRRYLRFLDSRVAAAMPTTATSVHDVDMAAFTKSQVAVKPFEQEAPPPASVALMGSAELPPQDEAIFLLQTAAEVEHSLMVQYLFAACSLETDQARMTGTQVPADAGAQTLDWRNTILQIAKEEMGHLLTVQNALRLLGGPLEFEREPFPSRPGLYPYPFELERLTKTSLAKYVAAEMPATPPAGKEAVVKEIKKRLKMERFQVNRVGALYARLIELVGVLDPGLFQSDTTDWQGAAEEWTRDSHGLIILSFPDRSELITALEAIAEQGEGAVSAAGGDPPHFDRFLAIYEAFPDNDSVEDGPPLLWQPSRPVAANPNTTPPPPPGLLTAEEREDERHDAPGRITDPLTLLWAQLFNVRYRILLTTLSHILTCRLSSNAPRPDMKEWTFNEMPTILKLLDQLASLPQKQGVPAELASAGAPFELPYTLALPDRESDRWRLHATLIQASDQVVAALKAMPGFTDPQGLVNTISTGNDDPIRRQLITDQIALLRLCEGNAEVPPPPAPPPGP